MAGDRSFLASVRKTGFDCFASDLIPLGGLQAGGAR